MELLCPAGSKESLIAAINSGADAVYLSGKRFGARAFASNFSNDELKEAIDVIISGNTYIQPILLPALNESMEDYALDKEKIEWLTKRELDVLRLISEGCSNKKISDELTISERTVKNHISHIFRKIDVQDRTQAAVFAIRNKIS